MCSGVRKPEPLIGKVRNQDSVSAFSDWIKRTPTSLPRRYSMAEIVGSREEPRCIFEIRALWRLYGFILVILYRRIDEHN